MILARNLVEGRDIPQSDWLALAPLLEGASGYLHKQSLVVDNMHTLLGNALGHDVVCRVPQEKLPEYDEQLVRHILAKLPKCWHSVGVDVQRDGLGNYEAVLFVFVRWYGSGERGVAILVRPEELRELRAGGVHRFADAAFKPFLDRERVA
jgi:hypothetical protein